MDKKETLKLALEALEIGFMGPNIVKYNQAITAIKEALAQSHSDAKQEQGEPVAWCRYEDGMWVYYETKAWDDLQPLYTTPQQRKPLTDEQIDDAIWRSHKVESNYAGWVTDQRRIWARAIEAAHGIGENT